MMHSDVISVNPSKATPGSLNADLAFEFARRHLPASGMETENSKELLNFVFASDKTTKASLPVAVGLLRFALAALLLTMILSGMSGGAIYVLAIACVSLTFGLLTRPVCGTCAVILTIMALSSSGAGLFAGTELMEAFACTVFAVTGAGNFSLDSRIRVSLLKLKRNRCNRQMRKNSEVGFITLKTIR